MNIDHNIPIPKRKGVGNRKYKWAGMEPGDSFFVAGATSQRLYSAAAAYKRYYNLDWSFRVEERTEKGKKGARIWRV